MRWGSQVAISVSQDDGDSFSVKTLIVSVDRCPPTDSYFCSEVSKETNIAS